MGKFQIQYLNKASNHASVIIGAEKALSFVVVDERRVVKGGPFQHFLAWCSYFVMVFVALCVFIPNNEAHATGIAHLNKSNIGLVKGDKAGDEVPADWAIRKSR